MALLSDAAGLLYVGALFLGVIAMHLAGRWRHPGSAIGAVAAGGSAFFGPTGALFLVPILCGLQLIACTLALELELDEQPWLRTFPVLVALALVASAFDWVKLVEKAV